jgi:hypothetical protein
MSLTDKSAAVMFWKVVLDDTRDEQSSIAS